MRVLQIVQQPARRGAELFALQLSTYLSRRGHALRTTYLYAHEVGTGLPVTASDQSMNGVRDSMLERIPGVQPRLFGSLVRQIKQFRPDIIQLNGGRTVKYGTALRVFGAANDSLLLYRNIGDPSVWLSRRAKRRVFSVMLRQLDGAIALTTTSAAQIRRLTGAGIPVGVIPNGIDVEALRMDATDRTSERRTRNVPMDAFVIAVVGSLSTEKRVDVAIRTIAELRSRGAKVHLWIAGDGPQREGLERLTAELELEAVVRFEGEVGDVAAMLTAADCLLLCSDTEGMPAVVLEAGALGLPAIASRVGGLPDCVVDGTTGILVSPPSPGGFAAAVLDIMRDASTRHAMGAAARSFCRGRFCMSVVARQYEAFYQSLTPRRRGGKAASSEADSTALGNGVASIHA